MIVNFLFIKLETDRKPTSNSRNRVVYGGTNRTIVSSYDALNRLSALTENGRGSVRGVE